MYQTKTAKVCAILLTLAMLTALLPSFSFAEENAVVSIVDEAGLKAIANDLSGHYRLDADIELSGSWSAIGSDSAPFIGSFDGNYHQISDLRIQTNITEDYHGLFGYVGETGVIKNTTVKIMDGSYLKGGNYVGAVAGYNAGTITNCGLENSEPPSSDYTLSGSQYVGGIAGYNTGTVSGCYNKAEIYASDSYAGGICGYCENASLLDSYNTGDITTGSKCGGITGYMTGSIVKNCLNTGGLQISGPSAKGHISGTGKTDTIENCYYPADTGWDYAVGGSRFATCSDVGHETDLNSWLELATAFELNGDMPWLKWENPENQVGGEPTDAPGVPTEVPVERIELNSSAEEMEVGDTKQLSATIFPENAAVQTVVWRTEDSTIAAVDQDGWITAISAGETNVIASAGGQMAVCQVSVKDMGTKPQILDGIYQIKSESELKWFALHTDETQRANAVLTADIALTDVSFLPMFPEGYAGTFSGGTQRHTISYNLTTSSAVSGLFGTIAADGVVENLKVAGTAAVNHNYFGGIAGSNQGWIQNTENAVVITPASEKRVTYAGGIVGKNTGILQDSINRGNIIVTDYAGGIAGENCGGSILRCENTGLVVAENVAGTAGGIAAAVTAAAVEDHMTFESCVNSGTVQGGSGAYGASGGIVGKEMVASSYQTYDQKPELIFRSCENVGVLSTGGEQDDFVAKVSGNCTITYDDAQDQIAVDTAKDGLTLSVALIKENPQVTNTISLPDTYADTGVTITWSSSEPSIIQPHDTYPYAAVILPEEGISVVTLTAVIQKGSVQTEKEFSVTVWSLAAILAEQAEDDSAYLQGALQALNDKCQGTIVPTSGADSNLQIYVKNMLAELGYEQIEVSLVSAQNPEDGSAAIAENGDITYFWADPSGFRGMWFANISVTFSLEKGSASTEYAVTAVIYWDRAKVEQYLEEEIFSEIQLAQETDKDLELPKYIGGKDGKTWVEIRWETSDSSVLAISEENQWDSADARYNPYVGKVLRGENDQTVTLTATAVFQRTNNANGGTEQEISLTKTYPIIVQKMDDAALVAIREKMQAVLDAGYDTEKLTDFVTGEKLRLDAVQNDIQLLIPKETGIENYTDYRFTVTSSNSDVIETSEVANAARAFVYRPLPGQLDETVTLTVFMTRLDNPNLTVSKSFDVTVKALQETEIQDAIALMEAAKAAYFTGINNGQNEDQYHITSSLSAFREVVWNADGTDVQFIYDSRETTNDGIVPDELPNWADQEDWRTFRSSNPKVLENETLRYNTQPSTDTFIRINSVLTHEIFGKYAVKFAGNEDYAMFQQLYQQPVEELVQVIGRTTDTTNYDSLEEAEREQIYLTLAESAREDLNKDIQVSFRLEGADGMQIETTVQNVKTGATVFEVFRNALQAAGYTYTAEGSYVQSITDADGNTLGEFSKGPNSGWMYEVNGDYPAIYMNACYLEDGDEIVVRYVTKATSNGSSSGGSSASGSRPQATVSPTTEPTATENPTENSEETMNFLDVQQGDWYYSAVQYVAEKELFKGTDTTHFSPEEIMTRGMLVTVLYRMAQQPAVEGSSPFVDVKTGEYYADAVLWAYQNGIVLGVAQDEFAPDETVTREQMAAILWRYAKQAGIDCSQRTELSAYTDADSISDYALEPLQWAVATGLINGTDETLLEPASGAERAQVAAILMRFDTLF